MRWLRRILGVGLLVGTWWVGWRFVAENQQLVSVHYVAGRAAEVALWKAVLLSFGLGAGLVALFGLWNSARSGLVARRYRKLVGKLEAEVIAVVTEIDRNERNCDVISLADAAHRIDSGA